MSMHINIEKNILRFDVPNSEANLNAQHNGNKQRTVGSYYMSERCDECLRFLNNLSGDFYVGILLTIKNCKEIIDFLVDNNYCTAFKELLIPQQNQLKALEWLIDNKEYFYKIDAPTINENRKYLKLDNFDELILGIKTLVLGDLCSVVFKKVGNNGYLIYVEENPNYKNIFDTNIILKWME